MSRKNKKAYASPITLKPIPKHKDAILRVVIETPKGSRNKYKFDPDLRTFLLSKVLPDGMVFPTILVLCLRLKVTTVIPSMFCC